MNIKLAAEILATTRMLKVCGTIPSKTVDFELRILLTNQIKTHYNKIKME